jgi:hypothetical protein
MLTAALVRQRFVVVEDRIVAAPAGLTWRHRQQREQGRCRAEATHLPDGLVGVVMSCRTSGSDLGRDAVDQPGPR